MKEATGELNMTVVTVVAIAALVAFFYLVIWPVLQTGMTLNSACNASNGGQLEYHTVAGGKDVTCGNGVCTYDNTHTRQCETSANTTTGGAGTTGGATG